MRAHEPRYSVKAAPEKKRRPWKQGYQHHWQVKPKRLSVLKFGSQEALEIMLDNKHEQEIWIAAAAANVPRKGSSAKRGDSYWMKQSKRVPPPFGQESPEEHRAATENNRRGALGKDRTPIKKRRLLEPGFSI